MTPFAIVLLSIGVADLIAGFSGRPWGLIRCSFACTAGVVTGLGLACLLGYDGQAVLVFGGVLIVLLPGWLWIRVPFGLSAVRGAVGFWGLLLAAAALIGSDSAWPTTDGGPLGSWLEDVPIDGFRASYSRALLGGALVMFLLATANGVVRLILAMSSEERFTQEEEVIASEMKPFRTERVIDPLDRLLIFGFVAAGQVTAAVLVVSLKTLLRFPEVSEEAHRVHSFNLDLVAGSLASWATALVAAALLRASVP